MIRFLPDRPAAAARIAGGGVSGSVLFFPFQGGALVVADLFGFPSGGGPCSGGVYGFHIHEGPSCAGAGFPLTGSHFNPAGCRHPYHAGDLPPLFACGGRAFLAVGTDRFQIPQIIGCTVVIHSSPDDFTSQPASRKRRQENRLRRNRGTLTGRAPAILRNP